MKDKNGNKSRPGSLLVFVLMSNHDEIWFDEKDENDHKEN
jgi:hypothetical protein